MVARFDRPQNVDQVGVREVSKTISEDLDPTSSLTRFHIENSTRSKLST